LDKRDKKGNRKRTKMGDRETRRRIYRQTTGRTQYFFNTEEGTVRACAYWLIMRPKHILALYKSTERRGRGFRVDGLTRIETLTNLLMVSSLGFRVRTDTLEIVNPTEAGVKYFQINYTIAKDAINRLGGPKAIDNRKVIMWKHRTYFQAMSTLQMYAGSFRRLTEGLETVPDVPGWLLTGMQHMREGVERPSTQRAIELAVGICDQELETEKRGYEEEIRKRDKQIDKLTKTIADMTRRDQMVAEEILKATPPSLPPQNIPTLPPVAPTPPAALVKNISQGRSAVEESVSQQQADEGASQRVQREGARSRQAFLDEVSRGVQLKTVELPPDTRKKADRIGGTLTSAIGAALEARRVQLEEVEDDEEDDDEEDDDEWDEEYGGKRGYRGAQMIGSMLYPLSSPRSRGGGGGGENRWRNKMNDVFTT
jgi:hypothetical protein